MATYTAPTPTELKSHWPAFAAVDDALVQYHIDRASRSVDQSWTIGDYTVAIELLACHYMVMAGLGTGAEAEVNANGLGGFKTIRSGQLTLERGAGDAGGGDTVPEEWAGSTYGRQFYRLLRQNRPRGTVAAGIGDYADGMYPPLANPAEFYPWGQ